MKQAATHAFLSFANAESASDRARQEELWQRLTTRQRCLLSTDGSLSLILSAFTNQNVKPVTLSQEIIALDARHAVLDWDARKEFLRRKVVLRTAETNENLIYAESDICLDRLSEPICRQLLDGNDPIGLILRQHRIESFRELVEWGEAPATEAFSRHFPDKTMLSRQYKIIVQGKPAMTVTEQFPAMSGLLR